MAEIRKPYPQCRDCQCAEHSGTTALAERKDAWNAANVALTEAAKSWPKHPAEFYQNERLTPPSVEPDDVMRLAHWLHYGANDD